MLGKYDLRGLSKYYKEIIPDCSGLDWYGDPGITRRGRGVREDYPAPSSPRIS
jgi:hypothetical protein